MTALTYGLIAGLISIGLILTMHLAVWIFA
jgi:Flp pilus assembly pilin Flp